MFVVLGVTSIVDIILGRLARDLALLDRCRLVFGPPCRCRQLQHRCGLPGTQARHQHDLSIRKFQRIVMDARLVGVDLPEARQPLTDLPRTEKPKRRLTLDVVVEGNLGAWHQANRYARLSNRNKATRDRVGKGGCHQPILDLSRP
jgi:hypothetical protein